MKQNVKIAVVLSAIALLFLLLEPSIVLWKIFNSTSVVPTVDINAIMAARDKNHHLYNAPMTHNSTSLAIPPIMHQLVPKNGVPMEWMKSYLSCRYKMLHSKKIQYTLRTWTDTSMREFILQHYTWFLTTYDAYPYHIQRVDAVRYFLLYHFGGLYLDLDIGCNFSPDFLFYLNSSTLFPITSPMGVSNDFMMAKPQSAFLRYVLTQLPRSSDLGWLLPRLSPYFTVMLSTGPMFLSRCLYEFARVGQQEGEVAVLAAADYATVLFFHVRGSSWHAWDGQCIAWCQSSPVLCGAAVVVMLCVVAMAMYNSLLAK